MSEIEQINVLPFRKIVQIAWRGIRIRLLRSLLVTSGIILAIAFLTYILYSDAFARHVNDRCSEQLIAQLVKAGKLSDVDYENQKIQTIWMVALALMISFVGIVNAMLMSVTERFREIGTMKCLGALDQFIVNLFLLESIFQGVAGTAAGIIIGLILTYAEGMSTYGGEVWTLIPAIEFFELMGSCFVAGVALAVAGAMYPARRAAQMQPVDALRSEM